MIHFSFAGTAGGNTRHEAEAIAPACVGLLPNPARDQVTVRLNAQQGAWHVQVFNMSGGLVQQNTLAAAATEWAFSVQDWPLGMYVVRLMNGPKALSQTFVVQHR